MADAKVHVIVGDADVLPDVKQALSDRYSGAMVMSIGGQQGFEVIQTDPISTEGVAGLETHLNERFKGADISCTKGAFQRTDLGTLTHSAAADLGNRERSPRADDSEDLFARVADMANTLAELAVPLGDSRYENVDTAEYIATAKALGLPSELSELVALSRGDLEGDQLMECHERAYPNGLKGFEEHRARLEAYREVISREAPDEDLRERTLEPTNNELRSVERVIEETLRNYRGEVEEFFDSFRALYDGDEDALEGYAQAEEMLRESLPIYIETTRDDEVTTINTYFPITGGGEQPFVRGVIDATVNDDALLEEVLEANGDMQEEAKEGVVYVSIALPEGEDATHASRIGAKLVTTITQAFEAGETYGLDAKLELLNN